MTEPEPKRVDFDKPKTQAELRRDAGKKPKPRRSLVPVLPSLEVDPEVVGKPDQRAVACVNMRLNGAPFHEIAKALEYVDAAQAKQAFIAGLTRMNPVEDWETLRQVEALRAETLFRRSLAMASADYLVVHRVVEDENGNEIEIEEQVPNTEKRSWHEQAAKDLRLHALITGAQAPARVEVSADTQELNQMVQAIIQAKQASGEQVELEADIWDAEEIPDDADEMGE